MASLAEMIMQLEKRIFVLERLIVGAESKKERLTHPKSKKQDDFRVAEALKRTE